MDWRGQKVLVTGADGPRDHVKPVEPDTDDDESQRHAHPDGRVLLSKSASSDQPEDHGDEHQAHRQGQGPDGVGFGCGQEDLAKFRWFFPMRHSKFSSPRALKNAPRGAINS